MKSLGGLLLILFGVLVFLFPQASAEAGAQTQRGWMSLLPWLRRRNPDDDWMTDVGVWRLLTRLIAIILIIVGFRIVLKG
jgi:hypothetical protein